MTDMPNAAHAKPRDHLWVVFVIAAAAAIEVCATWVGIGNVSGFPVIGLPFRLKVNTDFSLMVGMEAYGGFALYYWLSAATGPRSRAFAMWSAAGALVLSLVGQVAYHVLAAEHVARPPAGVVGFVSSLPVVVLGFAAILMHLVHLDREGAGRTAREAAEADERTALRAELEALAAEAGALREALAAAQQQAAEDAEKRAILERKLAAQKPVRKRANPPRAKSATARANQASKEDVDARTKALEILEAEPRISGAELGLRVGMSKRWGQLNKPELAAMTADF